MTRQSYDYGLAITSQFYFCGLPLRLDTYSRCTFSCAYCFAHARGGAHRNKPVAIYPAGRFAHRLDRIEAFGPKTALEEFVARRQPIHFGGMSDPFSPSELKWRASLELMRVLADRRYPTVISTKSDILGRDEYLRELKRGNFNVQISLSSTDNKLIARVDRGTPGPKRLVSMVRRLANEGIPVTCRVQPVLPTREGDVEDVIRMCAEAGARHVATEHLKLAVEKTWGGTQVLSDALGLNVIRYFKAHAATRVGREWVLPVEQRLENVVRFRNISHALGLTFGAADNDLLPLSDGNCCCSGIDFFKGFGSFFSANYLTAIRKSSSLERTSVQSCLADWIPTGSVARHINSRSRIKHAGTDGGGIRDYVRKNWNGSDHGHSPLGFYGVRDTGEVDAEGYKLYELTPRVRTLMESRVVPSQSPSRRDNSAAHG